MAERYSRLFTLAEDLYTPGAPLVIAAGALLKDTQTGQVLAQLKMRSISARTITAVNLQVIGYDMSKAEVCREEHQYLDLKIARNESFGSKEAIPLSRRSVRSFAVKLLAVYFEDGESYQGTDTRALSLPEQEDLNSRLFDAELIRQYKLETSERSRYVPLDYKDLWLCSCGGINHDDEARCCRCGCGREDVRTLLNVELLRRCRDERLREEAEHAKQREARKKSRGYRLRRLALILIPLLLIAGVAAAHYYVASSREAYYTEAAALYEAGDYAGAAEAFDRLNEYRDAAQRAAQAREADATQTSYLHAGRLMDNERYEDAREIYLSLGDYRDSAALAVEAEYRRGRELIETGDYEQARALFEELGAYKDAEEISKHFYDRLLSEELSFSEEAGGALTTSYTYDSKGRIATRTEHFSAHPGKTDKVYRYTWEDDGSHQETEGRTVRGYDACGSYTSQDGQTLYSYEYDFFENGVLHYRESYDAITGDYLGGVVNDERGNTLHITDKNGVNKRVSNEYKGARLIKQETYAADGTMIDRMTFEYDAQGRLKRSSYVTPGASAAVTRSYTYGLIYVPAAEG